MLLATIYLEDLLSLAQVYQLKLRENLPRGSLITTVHANDLDSGEFGRVSYYIPKAANVKAASQLISVDPESGEVRLLQALDREKRDK